MAVVPYIRDVNGMMELIKSRHRATFNAGRLLMCVWAHSVNSGTILFKIETGTPRFLHDVQQALIKLEKP